MYHSIKFINFQIDQYVFCDELWIFQKIKIMKQLEMVAILQGPNYFPTILLSPLSTSSSQNNGNSYKDVQGIHVDRKTPEKQFLIKQLELEIISP